MFTGRIGSRAIKILRMPGITVNNLSENKILSLKQKFMQQFFEVDQLKNALKSCLPVPISSSITGKPSNLKRREKTMSLLRVKSSEWG